MSKCMSERRKRKDDEEENVNDKLSVSQMYKCDWEIGDNFAALDVR